MDWRGGVDDPVAAFSTIGILLVPSLAEGLGLVLLEAAVLGVPAIASDVGGTSETVHPQNRHLLLVPAERRNDTTEWAWRIRALSDRSTAEHVVALQRWWIREKFDPQALVEMLIATMEEVSCR